MPPAGTDDADRARAHFRWAQRYNARERPEKAALHIERAVHYMHRAQARPGGASFGAPQYPTPPTDLMVGTESDTWGAATDDQRAVVEVLLESEKRGESDTVARYPSIVKPSRSCYRSQMTGGLYILTGKQQQAQATDVIDIVTMAIASSPSYLGVLYNGIQIVEDWRPGNLKVSVGGAWKPAYAFQKFAYFDFMRRTHEPGEKVVYRTSQHVEVWGSGKYPKYEPIPDIYNDGQDRLLVLKRDERDPAAVYMYTEQAELMDAPLSTLGARITDCALVHAETQRRATKRHADESGGALVRPQVPWVSLTGKWELLGKHGDYSFDSSKMTITSSFAGEATVAATVVITKCLAPASGLPPASSVTSLRGMIGVKAGSIVHDMQAPQTPGERHKVFVLPSQLNAAEYPSHDVIVRALSEYLTDGTGGPAGQLAGDPGIAQFIIDNASNGSRPTVGIDNTRGMGTIRGVSLVNGYLKVDTGADVAGFEQMLPEMTVLGVRDVPVRGLDAGRSSFVKTPHTVDLVYASAVPVGLYTNMRKTEEVRRIAGLTLLAQYTGAMRLAVERGNCDLYLMPLGGGVFGNDPTEIRAAMVGARNIMHEQLHHARVEVIVLAFHLKKEEVDFFSR